MFENKRPVISPNSLGAVIVDMQPAYFRGVRLWTRSGLIREQTGVIRQCATLDIPLFVVESGLDDQTIAPIWERAQEVPRMTKIKKYYDGGFAGKPDLDERLRELGINTLLVIVMGIYASACVRGFAKAAVKRGYKIHTARRLIADSAWSFPGRSKRWYDKNATFSRKAPRIEKVEKL